MSEQSPAPAAHRETLLPGPWAWVAALAVAATLGLVFLPSLGPAVALTTAAAAMAGAALGLWLTSARIEVRDGELLAGRAQMPVRFVGRVRVMTPERMRALRGPEADARAYLCQRSWVPGGVLIEVVDPADPTPYWLVSSRTPQRLAAALERAKEASSLTGTDRGEPPESS
ncbi:MAG: DUF3093 domain-containing protein [Angustibacter sp.]